MSRADPGERDLKSFLEHLEDFRKMLIQCLIVLFIALIVAFPLVPFILDALKAPLLDLVEDPDKFLRSLKVVGAFSVAIRTGLWAGLLLATPFMLYFIARFVFPGLTEREKKLALRASGFAALLFFMGSFLGYWMTLPVALEVMMKLHSWLGIQAEWTIDSYVAFTLQLLIGFGLAFELPLLVVILGRLGIVNSRQLREKRKHVLVGLLVLAMVLTPPDVITQMMMAVPLFVLYEVCIWLTWASEKKNADTADGESTA